MGTISKSALAKATDRRIVEQRGSREPTTLMMKFMEGGKKHIQAGTKVFVFDKFR